MAFKGVPAGARGRVWLFDLDNTLHDASHAAFAPISAAMTAYIAAHTGLDDVAATALRQQYWRRYGATLLGLVRHHAVHAGHFLEQTHVLAGLEARLRTSAPDRAALRRLRGRKYVLTNAPRAYALRVLGVLGFTGCFDGVIAIEDMTMFGALRPKPDRRMLRRVAARLHVPASRCCLVEDTLEHQKAARSLGMSTVWMQRYLDGRFRGLPGRGTAGAARSGTGWESPTRGAATSATPGREQPGGYGVNSEKRQLLCSVQTSATERREVGIHPCPDPMYVCAKIRSLRELHRRR